MKRISKLNHSFRFPFQFYISKTITHHNNIKFNNKFIVFYFLHFLTNQTRHDDEERQKNSAKKEKRKVTGLIGTPSMASDALSELVNGDSRHYFQLTNLVFWAANAMERDLWRSERESDLKFCF